MSDQHLMTGLKALAFAIAHRLRKWWWQFAAAWTDVRGRCHDCGKPLSAIERNYYAWQCENCVGDDMGRPE